MGKSARQRKDKTGNGGIKLAHPDRSGPTEETLLQFAQQRNLFDQADNDPRNKKNRSISSEDEADEPLMSPTGERIMETVLWTVSLAMVHFTFDFLVQHQYGMSIDLRAIVKRTVQAFTLFFFLFYILHPHPSNPILLPGLPRPYQDALRQWVFFFMSIVSGCYIIYITNEFSYLAVLKQAPTLGCLWLWAVIELPLSPAILTLAISFAFFWLGGYSLK